MTIVKNRFTARVEVNGSVVDYGNPLPVYEQRISEAIRQIAQDYGNGCMVLPPTLVGWMQTNAGEALVLNTSSTPDAFGFLVYRLVD